MLVYVVLVLSTDAMWAGFDALAAGVAERAEQGNVWRAVAALVGFVGCYGLLLAIASDTQWFWCVACLLLQIFLALCD